MLLIVHILLNNTVTLNNAASFRLQIVFPENISKVFKVVCLMR